MRLDLTFDSFAIFACGAHEFVLQLEAEMASKRLLGGEPFAEAPDFRSLSSPPCSPRWDAPSTIVPTNEGSPFIEFDRIPAAGSIWQGVLGTCRPAQLNPKRCHATAVHSSPKFWSAVA